MTLLLEIQMASFKVSFIPGIGGDFQVHRGMLFIYAYSHFSQDLHCIHRELLSNLSLAVSTTLSVMTLGEVFIKIRDRLLIYGEYCGHVQKAQTLVLEITKNDIEKRSKIQDCQSQSDNYSKFHLTELLTVPMQRVLKYHLLLEVI